METCLPIHFTQFDLVFLHSSLNTISSFIINWHRFGLVWFYYISIIVGYFMPNPLYKYICNT